MVTWLTRRSTLEISRESLPETVRDRIEALFDAGVRVVLKDISLDSTPVVLVFGQCVDGHFTIIAAASEFKGEMAVDRALAELETAVAAVFARSDSFPKIAPDAVVDPEDHVTLYGQQRYFRRADWLMDCGGTIPLDKVESNRPATAEQLVAALEKENNLVFWSDFTNDDASLHQGRAPLKIVRVLVSGFVPINFGYGTEVLGMPRISRFGGVWRPNRKNAFFPHPFY